MTPTNWPKAKDIAKVYGDPRGPDGRVSLKWEAQNIVRVEFPWDAVLAWDKTTRVKSCRIHRACAASLERVFRDIWRASGHSQSVIEQWGMNLYGGGYEFRAMRGSKNLSMHAYGAAIDFDPARNAMGDTTPNFANIPQVLKAFEAEGWTWGGEFARADGMHWEATS